MVSSSISELTHLEARQQQRPAAAASVLLLASKQGLFVIMKQGLFVIMKQGLFVKAAPVQGAAGDTRQSALPQTMAGSIFFVYSCLLHSRISSRTLAAAKQADSVCTFVVFNWSIDSFHLHETQCVDCLSCSATAGRSTCGMHSILHTVSYYGIMDSILHTVSYYGIMDSILHTVSYYGMMPGLLSGLRLN
jgi:hypothetical protein